MTIPAQAVLVTTGFTAAPSPSSTKRRARSAGPASQQCRPVYFNTLLLLCGLIGILPGPSAAQEQAVFFADHPVLTPDGDTVIFAYEGDLWKAGVAGGLAVRLTAMEGIESRPSVSPDGRWLAFTGRQYGNGDVYLIPLAGGNIRQLTFHEADDEVESWSWDNRRIFFLSDEYNGEYNLYELVDGSFYRLPAWGCYTLEGRNLEKTGVTPDIYVRNTFADRLQGADPQLDRAIRFLLERLDNGGPR